MVGGDERTRSARARGVGRRAGQGSSGRRCRSCEQALLTARHVVRTEAAASLPVVSCRNYACATVHTYRKCKRSYGAWSRCAADAPPRTGGTSAARRGAARRGACGPVRSRPATASSPAAETSSSRAGHGGPTSTGSSSRIRASRRPGDRGAAGTRRRAARSRRGSASRHGAGRTPGRREGPLHPGRARAGGALQRPQSSTALPVVDTSATERPQRRSTCPSGALASTVDRRRGWVRIPKSSASGVRRPRRWSAVG